MEKSEKGEITIIDGEFSWESEASEKHHLQNPDEAIKTNLKLEIIKKQIAEKKKLKEDTSLLEKEIQNSNTLKI